MASSKKKSKQKFSLKKQKQPMEFDFLTVYNSPTQCLPPHEASSMAQTSLSKSRWPEEIFLTISILAIVRDVRSTNCWKTFKWTNNIWEKLLNSNSIYATSITSCGVKLASQNYKALLKPMAHSSQWNKIFLSISGMQ